MVDMQQAGAVARQTVRKTRTLSQWLYDKLFGRGRELPLQADGIAIALAALLGVMVLLAALGLGAGALLGSFAGGWEQGRANEFTVEIRPLGLPNVAAGSTVSQGQLQGAPAQSARTGAALQMLRGTAGVASAIPLGDDELHRLLSPWLGPDLNLGELPLPVLITVTLAADAPAGTLQDIAQRLPRAIPGVRVDDHGAWLAELRQFVHLLQGAAAAIIALLAGAAALTVILVTRISLLAHRDVVEILHTMGATDRHIAWQFQTYIARIAAIGSGGGALLALVSIVLAQAFASALTLPLLPAAGLHWWLFAFVALLPLPTVLLATIVARVTALWWVRRLP